MSTQFDNGMWPNAVHPSTLPPWFLNRAIRGAMRLWDQYWRPVMNKYLPYDITAADGNKKFSRDIAVDPGIMAQFNDLESKTPMITEGYKKEDFQARRTAIGFYMNPEEMVHGVPGKIKRLTKVCAKAISRRIEYESLRYVSGETATIGLFSPNVATGRMLTADLGGGASQGFTGISWDTTNSKPFEDLDNAQEKEDLAGDQEFVAMILGPTTYKLLKNQSDVLDRIKYVKNIVTGSVIGATFNGMALDVVRGQTYKEPPNMTTLPDSPGLGDLQEFTWSAINKKRFMFHTVESTDYEYVLLIAESNVGNICIARSHVDDKNWRKLQPFLRTWKTDDPEYRYWGFSKNFCPYVEDFVNIMRLNRSAQIVNS